MKLRLNFQLLVKSPKDYVKMVLRKDEYADVGIAFIRKQQIVWRGDINECDRAKTSWISREVI